MRSYSGYDNDSSDEEKITIPNWKRRLCNPTQNSGVRLEYSSGNQENQKIKEITVDDYRRYEIRQETYLGIVLTIRTNRDSQNNLEEILKKDKAFKAHKIKIHYDIFGPTLVITRETPMAAVRRLLTYCNKIQPFSLIPSEDKEMITDILNFVIDKLKRSFQLERDVVSIYQGYQNKKDEIATPDFNFQKALALAKEVENYWAPKALFALAEHCRFNGAIEHAKKAYSEVNAHSMYYDKAQDEFNQLAWLPNHSCESLAAFKKQEILEEAFKIISKNNPEDWRITRYFSMEEDSITFTADCYYDPVLTFLTLRSRGIISAKVQSVGSESDRVTITGCNIAALRSLDGHWPDCSTVEDRLSRLGYFPLKKEKKPSPVVLVGDEEKLSVVDSETFDGYFKSIGQAPNPYNIPSIQDLNRFTFRKSISTATSSSPVQNDQNTKQTAELKK